MPDDMLKKELSEYRFKRAKEDIVSAKALFNMDDLRAANNRAYYSIFHALRAVLILDGYDSKKHSGIISEFRKKYIKEGIFDSKISDIIRDAFVLRNASDYDDMYIAEKKETEKQIEDAEYVLNEIESYLKGKEVI